MSVRRYEPRDARRVWALSTLSNIGRTADPTVPLGLPLPEGPPPPFPHLANIEIGFHAAGGDFLVIEREGYLVAMGGIRPNTSQQAEVLHVRVHPATRRQGIGRKIMSALEHRALELGFQELHLDTATNQPEAVAFYEGLDYIRLGEETRPEWSWTLVFFTKQL